MQEFNARKRGSKKGTGEMSAEYIVEAKRMCGFLLNKEYRGPGDTIEAAAYRMQARYGIHHATTMRLRNEEVRDMKVSSFAPILNAYLAVRERLNSAAAKMERAYEEERNRAVDPRLLGLARAVAGEKTQETEG